MRFFLENPISPRFFCLWPSPWAQRGAPRAGSQAGAHSPRKAPSSSHRSRLGWVMGHLFAFPGYLLCSESMSSCNQEIGRPQKMKGKLSKRLSSFSNPAGNGLCVGYWIAVWAQLTHLSHHKSAHCILDDIGQINSGIARGCLLLKCKTKMGKLDIGHWPENQELIWNPLGILLLFSLPWKYNFGYIAYG